MGTHLAAFCLLMSSISSELMTYGNHYSDSGSCALCHASLRIHGMKLG